jgi:hypothetical protein
MEEWAFDFRFVHARVEPRIKLVGAWDELGDRQRCAAEVQVSLALNLESNYQCRHPRAESEPSPSCPIDARG